VAPGAIEATVEPLPGPAVSDSAAFWGLVAVMAMSPGEVLLPIYLSSATDGVGVLALLTLTFAAGTVLGMVLLTALASAGASILRLERWARYEGAVLGVALIGLGLLVLSRQL
jgi:cytochrome c biogenesis protein CcdA